MGSIPTKPIEREDSHKQGVIKMNLPETHHFKKKDHLG
jgi:hypothetical protein